MFLTNYCKPEAYLVTWCSFFFSFLIYINVMDPIINDIVYVMLHFNGVVLQSEE